MLLGAREGRTGGEKFSQVGPRLPLSLGSWLGGRDQENLWPVSIHTRFLETWVGIGRVKAGRGSVLLRLDLCWKRFILRTIPWPNKCLVEKCSREYECWAKKP